MALAQFFRQRLLSGACALLANRYTLPSTRAKETAMAVTVTVAVRVQSAAKKLPVSESKVLGEFIRQVIILGVNPNSAASTVHAHSHPVAAADKTVAFGGAYELVISEHHRVFYKLSGAILTLTNLEPVTPRVS